MPAEVASVADHPDLISRSLELRRVGSDLDSQAGYQGHLKTAVNAYSDTVKIRGFAVLGVLRYRDFQACERLIGKQSS
jgi:hypothetical protein